MKKMVILICYLAMCITVCGCNIVLTDNVTPQNSDVTNITEQPTNKKDTNVNITTVPVNENITNDSTTIIPNLQGTYLDELSIIDSDKYIDNDGDSFVYAIGEHKNSRGNVDVNGNLYEHGIEAWIARWNYTAEKSWAYATYLLDKKYTSVKGNCVLIDSYNTNNFDSTLEFYADDKLIKSYHLIPDSIPFEIDLDIKNIEKLKIYIFDNMAVCGGTSFGLTDMELMI